MIWYVNNHPPDVRFATNHYYVVNRGCLLQTCIIIGDINGIVGRTLCHSHCRRLCESGIVWLSGEKTDFVKCIRLLDSLHCVHVQFAHVFDEVNMSENVSPRFTLPG
ncbi:hypothetical protein EGR_10950 [Echinococcus granulosus]|uniref:Uncharacterized protein n=1 Tax=Echinococcus granulosus TaxID=6210 RepID=W6UL08_ECHGR|nr:hypothetical protein EGR_10950 [Echinococcus granulosus]EUB54189.1 hypothetical protein EGR_10950 [Echinococcus granulosus]